MGPSDRNNELGGAQSMTPGLCLDSGEFIPASELNRRTDMTPLSDRALQPVPPRFRLTREQVLKMFEDSKPHCKLYEFRRIVEEVELEHGITELPE
jgi:hypothetical protein